MINPRYYFKRTKIGECLEECPERKSEGVMIGSIACQDCGLCIEYAEPDPDTKSVDWIRCTKIKNQ